MLEWLNAEKHLSVSSPLTSRLVSVMAGVELRSVIRVHARETQAYNAMTLSSLFNAVLTSLHSWCETPQLLTHMLEQIRKAATCCVVSVRYQDNQSCYVELKPYCDEKVCLNPKERASHSCSVFVWLEARTELCGVLALWDDMGIVFVHIETCVESNLDNNWYVCWNDRILWCYACFFVFVYLETSARTNTYVCSNYPSPQNI